MNGRHELKYYISPLDCANLRTKLGIVAKKDENADDSGGYKIRSLYFDNYDDKAVIEKLSGQSKREKFRLRFYGNNVTFVRLEKKSKANRLTYKRSTSITINQCQSLLNGDYTCLHETTEQSILFSELYSKMRYQGLRPKNIVEYRREAYVYKAGNVRITLDSQIRTSNNIYDFLDPNLITIPATQAIIMEVKYDGFFPDVIRDLVQIGGYTQTEFSKYVVARMV